MWSFNSWPHYFNCLPIKLLIWAHQKAPKNSKQYGSTYCFSARHDSYLAPCQVLAQISNLQLTTNSPISDTLCSFISDLWQQTYPFLTLCAHWFQITNNLLLSDTLCSLVSNQWQLAPFWHSVLTASLAHKSLHASCKLHGQCSGAVYCFFVVVFPLYYNIFLVQI